MKKTIKTILGILIVSIAFIGCEEEDKKPINLLDLENSKSPFVRIIIDNPIVAAGDIATSSFTGTVDALEGNVASWELSVSRESGGVASDTVSLTTVTTFPSQVSIPYTDIANALGISTEDISGGDFIRFLGTATGTDGSVFTFDNFSPNVTGQPEQRQAFNFIVLVKCSPITDATVAGTWIIEMQDLFGDGWDGAFVTFEIDGVPTNYTFTAGAAATFNVDVPAGTSQLVISYTSGAFEEEHVYTIQTPDGDVRGPFGPNPAPCIN
ncbi:hypothetical protein FK220_001120 [Flavobacteriaceae bacterium TP-CH-4]|uniref:Uncharacterized protein n=1 Tax=Pelagihabitans pacificus TaxID=2696054 RepID=A0A967APF6_9FLAO|nr:hypothetical protein [Pelagihabitans pacificus]NHF57923.1 hypothetical protein [Pelagihabitans pacificus]